MPLNYLIIKIKTPMTLRSGYTTATLAGFTETKILLPRKKIYRQLWAKLLAEEMDSWVTSRLSSVRNRGNAASSIDMLEQSTSSWSSPSRKSQPQQLDYELAFDMWRVLHEAPGPVIGRCGSSYFLSFYPRASPYLAILARRRRDAEDLSSIFEPDRLPFEFRKRIRPAHYLQPWKGWMLSPITLVAPDSAAAVLFVTYVEKAYRTRLLRLQWKSFACGVNQNCALIVASCGSRHDCISSCRRRNGYICNCCHFCLIDAPEKIASVRGDVAISFVSASMAIVLSKPWVLSAPFDSPNISATDVGCVCCVSVRLKEFVQLEILLAELNFNNNY